MKTIVAETWHEGWAEYSGGYWARIAVRRPGDNNRYDITTVRPDGSLADTKRITASHLDELVRS